MANDNTSKVEYRVTVEIEYTVNNRATWNQMLVAEDIASSENWVEELVIAVYEILDEATNGSDNQEELDQVDTLRQTLNGNYRQDTNKN